MLLLLDAELPDLSMQHYLSGDNYKHTRQLTRVLRGCMLLLVLLGRFLLIKDGWEIVYSTCLKRNRIENMICMLKGSYISFVCMS